MGRVFFNTRKNVHNLAAVYQVLASDSGKKFSIDLDATFVITLPAHQEGLNYEFVVTDAGSGEVHVTSGVSANMKGWAMDPTTGINVVNNILVEFAGGTAILGDVMRCYSDGTNWIVEAFSGGSNGIVGADS